MQIKRKSSFQAFLVKKKFMSGVKFLAMVLFLVDPSPCFDDNRLQIVHFCPQIFIAYTRPTEKHVNDTSTVKWFILKLINSVHQ